MCGPNSEGIYKPSNGLCATFSPAVDPEHGFEPAATGGPIAIVSQSGGLAFALLNHAQDRGLAIDSVISTGNEADLGWADYVDYLLDQADVRAEVCGLLELQDLQSRIAVANPLCRDDARDELTVGAIVLRRVDCVSAAGGDERVDEAWMYGLIRQESRFVTVARSGVGASGLMQLMPATAHWVANKIGLDSYAVNDIESLKFDSDGAAPSAPDSASIQQPAPAPDARS